MKTALLMTAMMSLSTVSYAQETNEFMELQDVSVIPVSDTLSKICFVDARSEESQQRCTTNFSISPVGENPAPDMTLVQAILDARNETGALQVSALRDGEISLDELFLSAHRVNPLQDVAPCQVQEAEVLQEPHQYPSGQRRFRRALVLRGFQYSGSENVNDEVRLPYMADTQDGTNVSRYQQAFQVVGGEENERIIMRIHTDTDFYEGALKLPYRRLLSVVQVSASGELVQAYQCELLATEETTPDASAAANPLAEAVAQGATLEDLSPLLEAEEPVATEAGDDPAEAEVTDPAAAITAQ